MNTADIAEEGNRVQVAFKYFILGKALFKAKGHKGF